MNKRLTAEKAVAYWERETRGAIGSIEIPYILVFLPEPSNKSDPALFPSYIKDGFLPDCKIRKAVLYKVYHLWAG